MLSVSLFTLFLAGLLGGGHCVGMCGGIVTAFSLHLPHKRRWQYLLGLNSGRLLGYLFIGMLMGTLGAGLYWGSVFFVQSVLQGFAAIILLLLGLYIAGLSTGITHFEKIGIPVWRRIQPLLKHYLPLRHWWQTLPAGFLWGWLPCGLVYTAAITAMASGSWWRGALCMLAFGLGTLPNLLLMGTFASQLKYYWKQRVVRLFCGLLIVFFAVMELSHIFMH